MEILLLVVLVIIIVMVCVYSWSNARPVFALSSEKSSILTITWDSVPGIEMYEVSFGTESGNYTTHINTKTNSIQIPTSKCSRYYLSVRSNNGVCKSAYSQELAIVPSTTAPDSYVSSIYGPSVVFEWKAVSGAIAYHYKYGSISGVYGKLEIAPANVARVPLSGCGNIYMVVATEYSKGCLSNYSSEFVYEGVPVVSPHNLRAK